MNELIKTLINKNKSFLPIWFMRQAGRYLPEFRKIRLQNKNFINLCLNSDLSSEITLQPIQRFDLDAAIIFSDILMVPYGLNQNVVFKKNLGPILSNFNSEVFLKVKNEEFTKKLSPVYEAIKKTRVKLNKKKALISFIGSPWTLVVYMLGLKQDKNSLNIDLFNKRKDEINLIFNNINNFLCLHIDNQIKAGANVIQIFDSWAGIIPHKFLNEYCFEPNKKIVDHCRNKKIPTICFPKGIKKNYYDFYKIVKPDGLSIDYDLDPEWARVKLEGCCIQGGLDPKILLEGNQKMFKEAEKYLKIFKNYPYIFNLGHGLLPNTDPINVEKLIKFARDYTK